MCSLVKGYLRELNHVVESPIDYQFVTSDGDSAINQYLGKSIQIVASGKKSCIRCGRSVKKLYQSGYCFPCVTTLAECDLCIVKPHECHFHLGTCRDESFAESHCMIPHYVYLAFSSDVKVGLTRKGRQLRRWVDQGASAAILVAEVPTRKLAGELEMEIAQHLPDKTDWRKMLKTLNSDEPANLAKVKADVLERLSEPSLAYALEGETQIHRFNYPRLDDFEMKLSSLSLDKQPVITGTLGGIKGQYLILDNGVFNVRKHAGYEVSLSVS